jgi:hypothetical protein
MAMSPLDLANDMTVNCLEEIYQLSRLKGSKAGRTLRSLGRYLKRWFETVTENQEQNVTGLRRR